MHRLRLQPGVSHKVTILPSSARLPRTVSLFESYCTACQWDLNIAIEKVVEWSKCWLTNGDIEKCMNKQIEEFMKVGK